MLRLDNRELVYGGLDPDQVTTSDELTKWGRGFVRFEKLEKIIEITGIKSGGADRLGGGMYGPGGTLVDGPGGGGDEEIAQEGTTDGEGSNEERGLGSEGRFMSLMEVEVIKVRWVEVNWWTGASKY